MHSWRYEALQSEREDVMESLFANIAELHARATALRGHVIIASEPESAKLREALHQLEAAVYAMERNAADAYKAMMSLG